MENTKIVNISETARDRGILSDILIITRVIEYPMYKGKISIFATFDAHLGFLLKLKNCKYLRNC